MDLPATALAMLTKFLNDESFADTILPSEYTYNNPVEGVAREGSSGLLAGAAGDNSGWLSAFALIVMLSMVGAVAYYAYQQR